MKRPLSWLEDLGHPLICAKELRNLQVPKAINSQATSRSYAPRTRKYIIDTDAMSWLIFVPVKLERGRERSSNNWTKKRGDPKQAGSQKLWC